MFLSTSEQRFCTLGLEWFAGRSGRYRNTVFLAQCCWDAKGGRLWEQKAPAFPGDARCWLGLQCECSRAAACTGLLHPRAVAAAPPQVEMPLFLMVNLPVCPADLWVENHSLTAASSSLAPSPLWAVWHVVRKAFAASSFLLVPPAPILLSQAILLSQLFWTKNGGLDLSEILLCFFFFFFPTLPGIYWLLLSLRCVIDARPRGQVTVYLTLCLGHWPTFHSNALVNSGTSYVFKIPVLDRED